MHAEAMIGSRNKKIDSNKKNGNLIEIILNIKILDDVMISFVMI